MLAAFLALAATGYSAWKLVVTGMLSWHVRQPETAALAVELLVAGLLFFLLFFYGKSNRIRMVGGLLLTGVFAWLHEAFFPVLFSGVYVGYLILAGRFFGEKVLKRKLGITWAFLLGSGVTISVFCLLSLAQLGSIAKLRFWVLGSGILLGIWYANAWLKKKNATPGGGLNVPKAGRQHWTICAGVMLAAIMVLLSLQMIRMNIAVDFDSIWYGVRSDVMLDSGSSIYENLGTLGVVYTYPKGWEVLTLPLAGLPSYSFPIAFNLWVAALVLKAAYDTACVRMESKHALWVPFLMAAIPGIMNMAGTAKADLITLFLQILMIQGVLQYEKERQSGPLLLGLSAAGLSLAMKPTAVIYSTAIVGIAAVWTLWNQSGRRGSSKQNPFREEMPAAAGAGGSRWIWAALLPSVAALAGIWGRTLHLVGVPVTSVFYQLFQKAGFHVKYPFYASGFPSAGGSMGGMEKLRFFTERLFGVLFNPQGEDMAHVVIAWGTVLPVVLLAMWLCMSAGQRKDRESRTGVSSGLRHIPDFLPLLTGAVLFINLVSLYSLSQIDGNYYMLFYALMILTGCIWIEGLSARQQRAAHGMLIPVWALAALLCMITNWAWALGSGEIRPVNHGYYNHIQAAREERTAQGSGAIWNLLAADPKNRVIGLGEHPKVLTFPCSVQSYVDVSGYWGNPEVVSDTPHFLQYLQYADTDYLYMEKEYVDTSVRIYQIVRELIEEGWLYDVREENGNLILSVQKETPVPELAGQNLEVFDCRYVQHP